MNTLLIFWILSLVEMLMFGWNFEVDVWSRFWRLSLIKIFVWTCFNFGMMNLTLGSVVPLAMCYERSVGSLKIMQKELHCSARASEKEWTVFVVWYNFQIPMCLDLHCQGQPLIFPAFWATPTFAFLYCHCSTPKFLNYSYRKANKVNICNCFWILELESSLPRQVKIVGVPKMTVRLRICVKNCGFCKNNRLSRE